MTAGPLAYTYAVARHAAGLPQAVDGLAGVVGSPVHLVHATHSGEVVAAVSPVPGKDFDEAALRGHLEDLGWLEALARSHHGVVEALAACTTVVPLRLATVYLDNDRVRAMLDDRRGLFLDQLSRLAGHVEWGVKLYVDAPAATQAALPQGPDLSPGRDYLRRRRTEQASHQDAFRAAERAAERITASATSHAVGHVRHRVQGGELAVESGANVLNDAYLVPLDQAEPFRAEVLRSTDALPGVHVVVTGPWAPYSFADAGLAEDDAP
ncbi:GvpL/GvpF family gas vesicle protein [Kitasatospora sp. NPDC050543]|uniref:GvpL/GvpF family gas vesicle protein n=1 Tax=Kitasatospora sp. NPDC050543 TaxID=3364054 RepID=UPI00379FA766